MHHTSRAKPIAIWGVSGLLTALYLFSGGSKLLDIQPGGGVAEAARHFGYPVAFMYFVGACEVAGAVGLLIPGSRRSPPLGSRSSCWAPSCRTCGPAIRCRTPSCLSSPSSC